MSGMSAQSGNAMFAVDALAEAGIWLGSLPERLVRELRDRGLRSVQFAVRDVVAFPTGKLAFRSVDPSVIVCRRRRDPRSTSSRSFGDNSRVLGSAPVAIEEAPPCWTDWGRSIAPPLVVAAPAFPRMARSR